MFDCLFPCLRPDDLEHGCSQDVALAVLLDQAFRIREEVAAGLQSKRGSVQVEAVSRKLLESHILTITRIVKQLSSDMQVLEKQITQRDSVTSLTTAAVQNLDQKSMASIGDLRGRVARCDASIVKLRADVSSGEQQVIKLQKDVEGLRAAVEAHLKVLEVKLQRGVGNLEALMEKRSQSEQSSMSDFQRQVTLLENRMSGEIKKVSEQTDLLRKWTEQQLNAHVQTLAQSSVQLRSLLQDKMLEAESRLSERVLALEGRVERCEGRRSQTDELKHCEAKLSRRMTSVENGVHQQLQLLKQEYHTGFLSVHDAIESLRKICDIRSRLDKEKLQRDNRHLRPRVPELGNTD
ncbi:protein FAM81B [Salarias fasciatus]|uniref:protein FAM81B n=1 Tax=Salarias fasciatus TaxID=181472 RepID=UPI00117708FC|nr:protein FAM81B [Salarias fasciatus]